MQQTAIQPPEIMPSVFGPELPKQRAADLPGMVSLRVKELFEDIPEAIYSLGHDLSVIRQATQKALASVNMDMIKEQDSINILCSEHAFNIQGGKPYAEMIKTIKDVVQDRTGSQNIRLVFCAGGGMAGAYPGAEGQAMGMDELGADDGALHLPGPRSYEKTLDAARNMIADDPKRVAQVVRKWISEDGKH